MILVDTSVLSLAFRRKRRDLNLAERAAVFTLDHLLTRGEVAIIGPIRQELLSGISDPDQFNHLKNRLAVLNDFPLTSEVFIIAASFYNICRINGVAAGDIDMMIAATADLQNTPIFTTDPDFPRYAKLLPIALFHP